MWSIPLIICAAIAGGVTLLVVGIFITIHIERQRHQRLWQKHCEEGCLPNFGRHHLPITNSDCSHNPPSILHHLRPEEPLISGHSVVTGEKRLFYVTKTPTKSEDDTKHIGSPENEPGAKRRRGLRQQLHQRSSSNTSCHRQRRLTKTSRLRLVSRTPLSAITESNQSSAHELPVVTDQPDEHTLQEFLNASENETFEASFQTANADLMEDRISIKPDTNSPDSKRVKPSLKLDQRSTSINSVISNPPQSPLPPLPNIKIKKRSKGPNAGNTIPIASIDTRASSILLHSLRSSPVIENRLAAPQSAATSGLQSFDFNFKAVQEIPTAKLRLPPGKQINQGYHHGKSSLESMYPSFGFHSGPSTVSRISDLSFAQSDTTIEDAGRGTRDVNPMRNQLPISNITSRPYLFETPKKPSNTQRNSCITGGASYFGKSALNAASIRPASVASSQPFQSLQMPSFPDKCYPLASTKRLIGHYEGQECATKDSKKASLLEHVNHNGIRVPEPLYSDVPGLRATSKPRLAAERDGFLSLENRSLSISGQDKYISGSSRDFSRLSHRGNENDQVIDAPRPDSDIFSFSPLRPKSKESVARSSGYEQLQSPPWFSLPKSKYGSSLDTETPDSSPRLPSPLITIAPLNSRKSLVKGPRKIRRSTVLSPSGSPTPLSTKREIFEEPKCHQIHNSTSFLRTIASEEQLLVPNDRPHWFVEGENLSINSMINKLATPNNSKIGVSPSIVSIGAPSIWEDMSVRADSPEFDYAAPRLSSMHNLGENQRQPPQVYVSNAEDSENFKVQPKTNVKSKIGLLATPQGKGLGLSMSNWAPGTPASLYDGDGFLRER